MIFLSNGKECVPCNDDTIPGLITEKNNADCLNAAYFLLVPIEFHTDIHIKSDTIIVAIVLININFQL